MISRLLAPSKTKRMAQPLFQSRDWGTPRLSSQQNRKIRAQPSSKPVLKLPPSEPRLMLPPPPTLPKAPEEKMPAIDKYLYERTNPETGIYKPLSYGWYTTIEGGSQGFPKVPGHIATYDPKSQLSTSRRPVPGTIKATDKLTKVRPDMATIRAQEAKARYTDIRQDILEKGFPDFMVPIPGMSSEKYQENRKREVTEGIQHPFRLLGAPGAPSNMCVDSTCRVTEVPIDRPESQHDPTIQEGLKAILSERFKRMASELAMERHQRHMANMSQTQKWMLKQGQDESES